MSVQFSPAFHRLILPGPEEIDAITLCLPVRKDAAGGANIFQIPL